MVNLEGTYVEIIVFDIRRVPDEVLRTMLFDERTKFAFSLYPKIAFVPTHVYKAQNYYERNIWSQNLAIVRLTDNEPHLKHWKDLKNVEINLHIEKLRYEGKLNESSPFCGDSPRQRRYIGDPLHIDS